MDIEDSVVLNCMVHTPMDLYRKYAFLSGQSAHCCIMLLSCVVDRRKVLLFGTVW